ncbi:MAG: glycosyltransferase [Patescibacteria group bacterium]
MNIHVTIGIPAYNEETNIAALLIGLLAQRIEGFVIDKILVISDGSTDRTTEFVKLISDPRIELVEHAKREGLNRTQNDIIVRTKSDILVIMNADVLPADDKCIAEIVKPIMRDASVGLVGGNVVSAPPNTFFESVIGSSHWFKQSLYENINHSETVYLCHGRIRAFSRDLYTRLVWPDSVPEDSYSYLLCKDAGYKFLYQKNARVLFRAPQTLIDHARQSQRFVDGNKQLRAHFGTKKVKRAFHIPAWLFVKAFMKFSLRRPVHMALYCLSTLTARLAPFKALNSRQWEISETTKSLLSKAE